MNEHVFGLVVRENHPQAQDWRCALGQFQTLTGGRYFKGVAENLSDHCEPLRIWSDAMEPGEAVAEPERPEPKYEVGQKVEDEVGKVWNIWERHWRDRRDADLCGGQRGWNYQVKSLCGEGNVVTYSEPDLHPHINLKPERPGWKYEPGRVVETPGGVRRVRSVAKAERGWGYYLQSLQAGCATEYYAVECALHPHTMTAADLTPAQRSIWPGMEVRMKDVLVDAGGEPVEGDLFGPGKSFEVASIRMGYGGVVAYAKGHAGGPYLWNLEPVEEAP